MMRDNSEHLGWIGLGRMGTPMAQRLLDAGHDVSVWNRTRQKAGALAAHGATVVDRPADLAGCGVVFTMVSTGPILEEVCFGDSGVAAGGNGAGPGILVDCSSIGIDQSTAVRARLAERGTGYLSAPVSGNAKAVKAGRLSAVVSGPREVFDRVEAVLSAIAGGGVSYVGDGELARVCKIAHNVLLGVVTQNLCEITVLAQKSGVPRHAFLDFINKSVMGSTFTRYKTPALVNLDWTTTFTPALLRKDLDLGLEAGRRLDVPMPVTAATREALQAHFGMAELQDDKKAYLQGDFAALLETVGLAAGMKLESENEEVGTGLE